MMRHVLTRFNWLVAAVVIATLATALALFVPTGRNADSTQGIDQFIVSTTDGAIDPTTGEAVVQISVKQRTRQPAAVRASIGYDASVAQLLDCAPIETWISCAETTPGTIVFEAVTTEPWSSEQPLLELTFDGSGVTAETLLDLEVETGLTETLVAIGAQADDGMIAPHALGDADCDAAASIADALIISQYTVGTRADSGGCPIDRTSELFVEGADINDDGATTIIDALIIAQCTVGIDNGLCP